MNTFEDIKDGLVRNWPQNANEELRETLDALVQLEADFHTLCREVASLSIDHFSKAYATSPEFDQMLDRRGVVLPVL